MLAVVATVDNQGNVRYGMENNNSFMGPGGVCQFSPAWQPPPMTDEQFWEAIKALTEASAITAGVAVAAYLLVPKDLKGLVTQIGLILLQSSEKNPLPPYCFETTSLELHRHLLFEVTQGAGGFEVQDLSPGELPQWLDDLLAGPPPPIEQDLHLPDGLEDLLSGTNEGCWCPPPPPGPPTPTYRRDPLVLDLDRDGIQTTNVHSGAFFDLDANGLAEMTGWVDPHDGLLVLDRNGNGIIDDSKELFSDQTILKDGTKAADGFQALAELDSNHDGKIDASDPAYSQLRVWKDSDGDGYSLPCELYTLEELGIKSINLDSTIVNITDPQGNTENRVGSFEWADGTIGQIGDYSFQRNTTYTMPTEWLDVPDDIAALPNLRGFGDVYDLQQAMVRDTSGRLKTLVQDFAAETDPAKRASTLEQIIFQWAAYPGVGLPGSMMDAQSMSWAEFHALENFYGASFMPSAETSGTSGGYLAGSGGGSSGGGGSGGGSISIVLPPWSPSELRAYHDIFESCYAALMSQTHLKDLFGKITYTWDDQTQQYNTDMSGVIAALQAELATDPDQGKQLLSEFARTMRGLGHDRAGCLACREIFIDQDPSLGWVIDSGGLPVYDKLGQSGQGWYALHMFGTDEDDAIQGPLTGGDGFINGMEGNDVIYGTDRNELIYSGSGDSLIVAGGGNDTVYAGAGNDILDGGPGNDVLYGEAGNDTYIFRRGSGQDTIIDDDPTAGNVDTIFLGSSLTPDDITLKRAGNDLVLKINDTTDTLTVHNFFWRDGTQYRVEQIQFMDGTVWNETQIVQIAYSPTEGDDVIYGGSENDALHGLGGNDSIYGMDGDDTLYGDAGNDYLSGGTGNDVLDGGPGDDTLDGGTGNNTYVFDRGDGQDTIIAQNTAAGNTDTIAFGDGVLPSDIKVQCIDSYMGSDLVLTITDSQDSITVKNWLQGDTPDSAVQAITFADGTTWDTNAIEDMLVAGTDGNDEIFGFSRADTIDAGAGDDVVYARGGDDTVDGGAGNDIIYGEAGNDTLKGGDGNDTLYGGAGDDTLDGGPGNDVMYGGDTWDQSRQSSNGNDTYLFDRSSGQDTVIDYDPTPGNMDTIQLADDLTPNDVTVQRNGSDLELSINGTSDTLTVQNWFWNDSIDYQVEQIKFADGTMWGVDDIKQMVLQGTPGDDVLLGYSTSDVIQGLDGNDTLYGYGGDDTVDGGAGNDYLDGGQGNDTLRGGDGNDTLIGGSGDDTLDGGPGSDSLIGGAGNDTYIFDRGYGRDTILDDDKTPGNLDTIKLADDITPSDVSLAHIGDNLQLSIDGTTDTLTVQNWFLNDSTEYQVGQIQFSDGTTWGVDDIKKQVLLGTPGDDTIIGYSSSDLLQGQDGNDTLYGRAGDDTLEGGAGNDALYGETGNDTLRGGEGSDTLIGGIGDDTLDGGPGNDTLYGGDYADQLRQGSNGNDTYLFDRSSGQDTVIDYDTTLGNLDTILLGSDLSPSDVDLRRNGDDLVLSISDTDDSMTVENWFKDESTAWQVEQIQFADGTTWNVDTIKQMVLQGTPGDDVLTGYSTADSISGLAGNDTIYGGAGNDTLDGGAGNDYLNGGTGNDTYIFGLGDGQDVIEDFDGTPGNIDTIAFQDGVSPSDVTLKAADGDLLLSINGTSDSLEVKGWFTDDAHKVERVQFSDGTVWGTDYIRQVASTPTDTNDYLVGTPNNDLIDGGGGNDTIYGLGGDDTLLGGTGDDYIDGGTGSNVIDGGPGNDQIIATQGQNTIDVNRGDGFDNITSHFISSTDQPHTIVFGPGITPDDLLVQTKVDYTSEPLSSQEL